MDVKAKYGEVCTPNVLVEKMINLFPDHLLKNKTARWIEPGSGKGNISKMLIERLATESGDSQQEVAKRIDFVEINPDNEFILRDKFDFPINLTITDFNCFQQSGADLACSYDAVISNPPFNSGGAIKTPTHSGTKKQDGKNAWCSFIHKSISLLRDGGFLVAIVPAIWLKPDKNGMYEFLTQFKIHKMNFMTNTETNRMFSGQAQTPTTYFLLEKSPTDRRMALYCNRSERYVDYVLRDNYPIPMINIKLINDRLLDVDKYGCLKIEKTNMPSKAVAFSSVKTDVFKYPNIRTCKLTKSQPLDLSMNTSCLMYPGLYGELEIMWSDKPCKWYGVPKIVLAHKMFGMPFFDAEGNYGISNRDNYVVWNYEYQQLERIMEMLSSQSIIAVYDATRYRMKYLEKYAFQFISIPK